MPIDIKQPLQLLSCKAVVVVSIGEMCVDSLKHQVRAFSNQPGIFQG